MKGCIRMQRNERLHQDANKRKAASGRKDKKGCIRMQRNERLRQEARGNSLSVMLAQFTSGVFIASRQSGLASRLKGPASGH